MTKINTHAAERELFDEAEATFAAIGVADPAARAKLVCERYRYRARRRVADDRNFSEARADIERITTGAVPC